MNKKEFSVLLGLIFTIIFSVCTQDIKTAQDIRQNTLRLHIMANSDSISDQQIKLAVRDEILNSGELVFAKADGFSAAVADTKAVLGEMEQQINRFLKAEGADYSAVCSVEEFYFDTTQYTGFALPQGEYTALTVRLGKAEGKNWWCVVYPALCSQSCGETALEDSSGFIKTDKITARFKVVEIFEDIKGIFDREQAEMYKNLP